MFKKEKSLWMRLKYAILIGVSSTLTLLGVGFSSSDVWASTTDTISSLAGGWDGNGSLSSGTYPYNTSAYYMLSETIPAGSTVTVSVSGLAVGSTPRIGLVRKTQNAWATAGVNPTLDYAVVPSSGEESFTTKAMYAVGAICVESTDTVPPISDVHVIYADGALTSSGQSISTKVDILSGSLNLSAPSVSTPFSSLRLSGVTQTTNASLSPLIVSDSTGIFNGWNVTTQASQFTEQTPSTGFSTGTSALTLPKNSLVLDTSGGSITAGSGSKPVSNTGGPIFKSTGLSIDTLLPVTILEANSNYGSGTYTVTFPTNALQLTLNPSTTKVDSVNYPSEPTPYTSTITFTVSSAP